MCSKIKHILLAACCFTGAGLMTSCNDGFMDRFPETSITEKVFFLLLLIWRLIPMACTAISVQAIRILLPTICFTQKIPIFIK